MVRRRKKSNANFLRLSGVRTILGSLVSGNSPEGTMDTREIHIGNLRAAEAQFRLATAARLAVTMGHQPLDLPIQWTHGNHAVTYACNGSA